MTKRDYYHELADFNEMLYDQETNIEDLESLCRIHYEDPDKVAYFKQGIESSKKRLEEIERKKAVFVAEYKDKWED